MQSPSNAIFQQDLQAHSSWITRSKRFSGKNFFNMLIANAMTLKVLLTSGRSLPTIVLL